MQSLFTPYSGDETGAVPVALSAAGHLAYATGGVFPEHRLEVVRLLPSGRSESLGMEPREYWFLRESPDGRRIASHSGPGQKNDIWVHDLTRGVSQKLNTGGFVNQEPTWSPDGKWLAFDSDRESITPNLYRMAADGSGEPQRLAPSSRGQSMSSWSSTGTIAYLEGGDIWILPPDGAPTPFFTSPGYDYDASFSPDGKWLAYASTLTDRSEVYVRPFPGPDPAVQISADGGTNPAWSPDGRQLFYRSRNRLMVVDVTPALQFQVGPPRVLFNTWGLSRAPVRGYDVTREGAFLTIGPQPEQSLGTRQIHVILNFSDELKQRLPR